MKKEIVIWGVPKGQEAWQEVILSTQCRNDKDIALIKRLAGNAGYTNIRVSIIDMEQAPDFIGAIK